MNTARKPMVPIHTAVWAQNDNGGWIQLPLRHIPSLPLSRRAIIVLDIDTGHFRKLSVSDEELLPSAPVQPTIDVAFGSTRASLYGSSRVLTALRPKFRYDVERFNADGAVASADDRFVFMTASDLKSGVQVNAVSDKLHAQQLIGIADRLNGVPLSKVRRHEPPKPPVDEDALFIPLPGFPNRRIAVLLASGLLIM